MFVVALMGCATLYAQDEIPIPTEPATVQKDDDVQARFRAILDIPLTKNLSLEWSEQARMHNNVSDLDKVISSIGINYKALPWLKEHGKEMTERILQGKYKPDPVRRKEIPKPDGGVRKLGIPSVKDRVVQQAIAQRLMPIYEPIFAEGSYGYRPGRSAQDAILKIRGYMTPEKENIILGYTD